MRAVVGAAGNALVFAAAQGCWDGDNSDAWVLEVFTVLRGGSPHRLEVGLRRYVVREGPGNDFAAVGYAASAERDDAVHVQGTSIVDDLEDLGPEGMGRHSNASSHDFVAKGSLEAFQGICVG